MWKLSRCLRGSRNPRHRLPALPSTVLRLCFWRDEFTCEPENLISAEARVHFGRRMWPRRGYVVWLASFAARTARQRSECNHSYSHPQVAVCVAYCSHSSTLGAGPVFGSIISRSQHPVPLSQVIQVKRSRNPDSCCATETRNGQGEIRGLSYQTIPRLTVILECGS